MFKRKANKGAIFVGVFFVRRPRLTSPRPLDALWVPAFRPRPPSFLRVLLRLLAFCRFYWGETKGAARRAREEDGQNDGQKERRTDVFDVPVPLPPSLRPYEANSGLNCLKAVLVFSLSAFPHSRVKQQFVGPRPARARLSSPLLSSALPFSLSFFLGRKWIVRAS